MKNNLPPPQKKKKHTLKPNQRFLFFDTKPLGSLRPSRFEEMKFAHLRSLRFGCFVCSPRKKDSSFFGKEEFITSWMFIFFLGEKNTCLLLKELAGKGFKSFKMFSGFLGLLLVFSVPPKAVMLDRHIQR